MKEGWEKNEERAGRLSQASTAVAEDVAAIASSERNQTVPPKQDSTINMYVPGIFPVVDYVMLSVECVMSCDFLQT